MRIRTRRNLAIVLTIGLTAMSCATTYETAYRGPPSGVDVDELVELCEAGEQHEHEKLRTARIRAKIGQGYGPRRKVCALRRPEMEVVVADGSSHPLAEVDEVVIELRDTAKRDRSTQAAQKTVGTVLLILLGLGAATALVLFIAIMSMEPFPSGPVF